MCGIAGLWTPGRWSDSNRATLQSMCDAIRHRGPDAYGHAEDESAGIALGHRRLAIIDLTPTGAQPMTSCDGRWVLVFNGEIYNFRDLRTDLESAGVRFRGHSDTEVFLEAVALWGVGPALSRIAGMFAIALWDARDRQLHLVRDRFGEKPLYYGWAGGTFFFASELKSLTASGLVSRTSLDRQAIAEFLKCSCIPAPRTIHEGVSKLRPAHHATVHADGRVEIEEYWSLLDAVRAGRPQANGGGASFTENVERLDARLRATVREQMISDVPLGALLSGGVDSSLVVALMATQLDRPVSTFSIGFHEEGYDEASFARQVAAHLGTHHTELYVSPREALDVIPTLGSVYDEPFADSSQVPTILVARLARAHVTVALSGDGGDEMFGGYERYFQGERIWRALSRAPSGVRRVAASAVRGVPPAAWDVAGRALAILSPSRKIERVGDRAHKLATLFGATSPGSLYEHFRSHWLEDEPLVLGATERPRWRNEIGRHPELGMTFIEEMMVTDALSYMTDDVLVKVDRAAMSTSLETRAPLLDHRVAELAWTMPLAHKVAGGSGKRVLKELLYRYVPRALIDRPKMGFGVPLDSWLRGPLRQWGEDLLSADRLRRQGLLRPEPIRRAWDDHQSGRRNMQYALWDVLMLQSWLDA